jgi:hypothetical protein
MNLKPGATYASLVNVAQPGAAGAHAREARGCSQQLPGAQARGRCQHLRQPHAEGGPYFNAAALDKLRAWIAAGAPNN